MEKNIADTKKSISVLLIEDDDSHIELIVRAFERKGAKFNLLVANNLRKAMVAISQAEPSLVITDWVLPDGYGIDVLPKDRDKQGFPVVVMTSYGNESIAVEAMKAGALDYVVKSNETFADMPRIAERALREWGHIVVRRKAEHDLIELNKKLEILVDERTRQLEETLEELRIENHERKKTAEELFSAKEELTRALSLEIELNKIKSRFISTISHEYRTPLTVILSSTYLAAQAFAENKKDIHDKHIGKIRSSVKLMSDMLDEVLSIGKSDAGRLVYHPSELNITDCVYDIFEETMALAKNSHILKLTSIPDPLIYNTDERLFRQLTSNLLSNAVKYSSAGSEIAVIISAHNSEFTITVSDKGIGIPEDDMRYIFEPFFRAGNTESISGTGLGLSIVKRCAVLLNGNIEFDSRLGMGTKVTVHFNKLK